MSYLYVFMDIDGTLTHGGRRFKAAGKEPSRANKEVYKKWLRKVQNATSLAKDEPVVGMETLCWMFELSPEVEFQYLTARENIYRDVTGKWLKKHRFPDAPLLMRAKGNYLPSAEYKRQAIADVIATGTLKPEVIVFDDDGDGSIEKMCKEEGYTFLKARSGGQE